MSNSTPSSESSPTPERPSTFFDYHRTVVNIVTDLTRLQLIAQKNQLEPANIQLIRDALTRNKDGKMSVAVVGEFKRGKSTFINALLGKDILPAAVEPCSATLNRITYGVKPGVRVVFRDKADGTPGDIEEIEIDQLSAYVTKLTPESEKMASTVKEAIVTYPLPYLMNNVELIDTPGLNDDIAMTDVTLGVLPEVAAAILVIMANSPFSSTEARFLNHQLLLKDMGRVIFVVTAIDQIRKPADRERILQVISDRIAESVEHRLLEQFGSADSPDYQLYRKQIGAPRVFGLSGLDALEAKISNDQNSPARSRFLELEHALERFVTQTRGAIELQVLANRTVAASNEILKKLTIELGAMHMSQKEFDQAYSKAVAEFATLGQSRQEELHQIDEALEKTKQRIRPMLNELPDQLKTSAAQVIGIAQVNPNDVGKPAFVEALGKEVITAITNAARRHSEMVQLEIERDVATEVNRLGNFANTVSKTLQAIELRFVDSGSIQQPSLAQSAMASALGAVNPFWGGALAGYQEAGGRGAAVGVGASLGTAMVGVGLLAALSLPITLPVGIVLGAAAAISGKFAARYTFREYRAERFKQQLRTQISDQIDDQLTTQRPDIAINQFITDAYQAIKDKLVGELDTSIEQTRSTLDQLRNQKARDETRAEHNVKIAEESIQEVQAIRSRAQGLSNQLIEVTSI